MAFVLSFGKKYGEAPKADLTYSVTRIPNPYAIPRLRVKRGTDPEVREWLLRGNNGRMVAEFVGRIVRDYEALHNPYAVIAIGCYGGTHRSVVVADEVAKIIGCRVGHRDLAR